MSGTFILPENTDIDKIKVILGCICSFIVQVYPKDHETGSCIGSSEIRDNIGDITKIDKHFIDEHAGDFGSELVSGNIDSRDVYIYYTKNPDGGYVRNHVDAEVTVIYMDENVSPYLISHYVETNKRHVQYIRTYDLHVPNGTITNKFNVV